MSDYWSVELHGPYELHDIGRLTLEEGGSIRGCRLPWRHSGR